MTNRLLVGSGSLLSTVVESLQTRPGSIEVATTDGALAESVHGTVGVRDVDEINRGVLLSFDRPDIVGVFGQNRATNRSLAITVRDVFPEAKLVVYRTEREGNDDHSGPTLESVADMIVDPDRELVDHIRARLGESGQRMRQLQRVLRGIDRLAVIAHDNPDPDAIASGLALAALATRAGCDTEVCYYGEITHQENRAFINVLDIELRNLDPEEDLSEFDGLALVDHSRPGVNDQLPPDAPVDIVIDHHPPRSPVDASFVDLRSGVGATSTLLVDYFDRFNVPIEEDMATALMFGIHVDTAGFSREVSQEDFTAAAKLSSTANFGMLERIESPRISQQTFETIASAISNREVRDEVLLSCVGMLSERDALAQAADRLLALDGISTTLVYGIKDGQIYISARSRGSNIDIGESLREAFGQIGSAGGHVDMAGAQIELGVLESVEDREESLTEVVEAVVNSRFLDVMSNRIEPPGTGAYMADAISEEYLVEDLPTDSEQTDE
ncbi:MAG: bifunctional oligoribonuclease/PAP phosphatase NrnA [Halovenus sp.]